MVLTTVIGLAIMALGLAALISLYYTVKFVKSLH